MAALLALIRVWVKHRCAKWLALVNGKDESGFEPYHHQFPCESGGFILTHTHIPHFCAIKRPFGCGLVLTHRNASLARSEVAEPWRKRRERSGDGSSRCFGESFSDVAGASQDVGGAFVDHDKCG